MEELIVISLNVITLAVAATVVARIKKWRKSEPLEKPYSRHGLRHQLR